MGRLPQLLERGITEFFRDSCGQRAAAISFYALFSLFPLAILSVAAFGVVTGNEAARERVITFVLDNLPLEQSQGRADLHRILLQVTGGVAGFGVLGLVTLLFSATGVMGSIRVALNAAFDARDTRPPVIAKLYDALWVIGFGVLVSASFALSVLDQVTGLPLGRLLPLAVNFAVFAILFRFVPARCPRLRDTWPGIVLAAIGLELAKAGFGLYLSNFAHYGAVYASLGSVVAFLMFVYLAASVALLGAEVSSEWPAVRAGAYDGPSAPLPKRVGSLLRGLVLRSKPAGR